ncbi:uncharacterized protein LOC132893838 [Neoarius graeffei]|uniref:uncharacterized protein LOC132893838 n=1 Tax=Neoarius graeffei TaxID=443677 RepID=UPI00298D4B33|nr:uncharacterized protein LOC132893838 [Neoarius graeffei]XP_060788975.1 uncharacterized protein LOC132893838 [Neoarius graeffei]
MEDQPKQGKASQWSIVETQTFLCVVAEERIQKSLNGATHNEKVFQEIFRLMSEHGYPRTVVQCQDKLKKLKSEYRQVKDHNGQSGASRKRWKWYDQMDAIYGHRPANQRDTGLDTAMPLLEAIDNDLVEEESASELASTSELAPTLEQSENVTPSLSADFTPAGVSTPALEPQVLAVSAPCPHAGKRKRSLFQEQGTVLRELQASAEAQCERYEAQRVAQHERRKAQREAQREQREAHRERLFELMLEDSRAARELEFAARSHQAAQSEAFWASTTQGAGPDGAGDGCHTHHKPLTLGSLIPDY